jgi:hypothetical protein
LHVDDTERNAIEESVEIGSSMRRALLAAKLCTPPLDAAPGAVSPPCASGPSCVNPGEPGSSGMRRIVHLLAVIEALASDRARLAMAAGVFDADSPGPGAPLERGDIAYPGR